MAVGKYQPLTLTPVNFSLTEGTSIPAPPDSPDSPRPPTPGRGPLDSHPAPTKTTFSSSVKQANSSEQLRKTTSTDDHSTPASPNGSNSNSKRPNSVRKFLGLHTMSSSETLGSERPGSPSSTAGAKPGLQRKKSSSWFSRRKSSFMMGPVLEGAEKPISTPGQRSVSTGHNATPMSPPPSRPTTEKKGPPPPALPALSSLGVTENTTSLDADDLFKNIK